MNGNIRINNVTIEQMKDIVDAVFMNLPPNAQLQAVYNDDVKTKVE